MSESTFTIEQVGHGRDYELVYREPGRELRLWMELAASGPYARLTPIASLNAWSAPDAVPIAPAHAAIIRARVEQWGQAHRTPIGFVETHSLEEEIVRMEQDGWIREDRADGTVLMTPSRRERLKRLWRRVGRLLVSR